MQLTLKKEGTPTSNEMGVRIDMVAGIEFPFWEAALSLDSLMLAQDKFTYQIFDLRFKQLTPSKKEGTPKGIPYFLVARIRLRLNHVLLWIRGFKKSRVL